MRTRCALTGRPIFYSIKPGGRVGCPPKSCSINLPIANMWRIDFDINASSFVGGRPDRHERSLYSYAGPGHWNDPDVLEVGNRDATTPRARPLQHVGDHGGAAHRRKRPAQHERGDATTLTNSEVIAVDQDPMGVQGRRGRDPGHEPRGLVQDAGGYEHAGGGALQSGHGGRIHHRPVERARHPHRRRHRPRPLEPHPSRDVQRLLHRVIRPEPRRRDAEGDQRPLAARVMPDDLAIM